MQNIVFLDEPTSVSILSQGFTGVLLFWCILCVSRGELLNFFFIICHLSLLTSNFFIGLGKFM